VATVVPPLPPLLPTLSRYIGQSVTLVLVSLQESPPAFTVIWYAPALKV